MHTPQKETPTTGSNQTAGVQQNDLAIVRDIPCSINTSTPDYVRELAGPAAGQSGQFRFPACAPHLVATANEGGRFNAVGQA